MARSRSPDIRAREIARDKVGIRTLGVPEEFACTREAWAAEVRASIARWAQVAKQANIKTE